MPYNVCQSQMVEALITVTVPEMSATLRFRYSSGGGRFSFEKAGTLSEIDIVREE